MATTLSVPVQQTELCTLCEDVIAYIDSLLEDQATEKDITKVVEKVCNFLPDNVKQEVGGTTLGIFKSVLDCQWFSQSVQF